jgi:soluble epoxide hydrolase / lipid-phosphate phosphatase
MQLEGFSGHDFSHKNGQQTHYYEGGSKEGTPLVFIHGWPDIAETWKHQLSHFAAEKKYRIIAPDMRGYGGSSSPSDRRAYSLETMSGEVLELLDSLDIKQAIWAAHDWGCGLVAALAAHYPERFIGLVMIAVPYRTIELGLNFIKKTINRDIYPESETEYGPWEYMRFYETNHETVMSQFEGHIEKITKVMYTPHQPENYGKPSPTGRVLRDGGWFQNHPELIPDVPLEYTFLDQQLYDNLIKSHKEHGFFPPCAWYLNHDVNEVYAKSEKNGGVLEFPVLYIDAKHDGVCSPSTAPLMGKPQEETCKKLTYETIEAAHWVHLEKPKEVNAAMDKWLKSNF